MTDETKMSAEEELTIRLTDMTARLMQCEKQRNEALNESVGAMGQLAQAGKRIGELQEQIVALEKTVEELTPKQPPARPPVKAKANGKSQRKSARTG